MVSAGRGDLESILDAFTGWDDVEKLLYSVDRGYGYRSRLDRWKEQLDNEHLLVRAMRHPRTRVRRAAAVLGRDLASVVSVALHDPSPAVRAYGASSRVAPLHLLIDVVDDPDPRPRSELARNERTPLSALVRLIDDPDRDIRRLTAKHPGFSPALLSELVFYPDWRVAEAVISNPSATPEVLALVASRDNDRPGEARRLAQAVTDRLASRVSRV